MTLHEADSRLCGRAHTHELWTTGSPSASAGGREVPKVTDRGLWHYTRHPNYFGDACVWLGIFCVCAERWPGVLTLFSPVIMVYLLAFGPESGCWSAR